jgi:hypothetical protein
VTVAPSAPSPLSGKSSRALRCAGDPNPSLSAVSIDTRYKNYNLGAVYFLQQRIAVLAQGADATSYSLEKFEATTHQQVGMILFLIKWCIPALYKRALSYLFQYRSLSIQA